MQLLWRDIFFFQEQQTEWSEKHKCYRYRALQIFSLKQVFLYRRIRRIIQKSFLATLTGGPSKDFGGLL